MFSTNPLRCPIDEDPYFGMHNDVYVRCRQFLARNGYQQELEAINRIERTIVSCGGYPPESCSVSEKLSVLPSELWQFVLGTLESATPGNARKALENLDHCRVHREGPVSILFAVWGFDFEVLIEFILMGITGVPMTEAFVI